MRLRLLATMALAALIASPLAAQKSAAKKKATPSRLPATHHWHQTLMDDSGAVLHLEGEFADGKMVLVGRRPSQKDKGVTITHRIVWTPMSDHRIRELWEASTNDGRTWRPVFEGTYAP